MRISILMNALAGSVLMVLAGCGPEYTYTPPATAAGQACVAQCQATQTDCADTKREQTAYKQSACEEKAEREHYYCLQFAKTDADRSKCQKSACYEYADTSQCETGFRACYQQCGGKVGILKQ